MGTSSFKLAWGSCADIIPFNEMPESADEPKEWKAAPDPEPPALAVGVYVYGNTWMQDILNWAGGVFWDWSTRRCRCWDEQFQRQMIQCGVAFRLSSRACRPSWRPRACCVPTLWAVSVAVMSIWAYLVEVFPVRTQAQVLFSLILICMGLYVGDL